VDVVEGGVYQGGFILPGITALQRAYAQISPVLDIPFEREIALDCLPKSTREGISYGILAPIRAIIERHGEGRELFFTGGDGAFLSTLFDTSRFDEALVFRGMQQALPIVGGAL
jgi:type III pantothenate kinase